MQAMLALMRQQSMATAEAVAAALAEEHRRQRVTLESFWRLEAAAVEESNAFGDDAEKVASEFETIHQRQLAHTGGVAPAGAGRGRVKAAPPCTRGAPRGRGGGGRGGER